MRFEEKLQLREELGIKKGMDMLRFEILEETIASGDENQLKIVSELLNMTVEEATSFYNAYRAKFRPQA